MSKLVDRVTKAAGSQKALYLLGAVSFAESCFLPVPVDPVALPIMLYSRRRLWQAALVATITSVLGGLFGYLIGAALWEVIGNWLINIYNLQDQFEQFKIDMQSKAAWMLFLASLTPIPFKLAAISAGAIKTNLFLFVIIASVGRGLRFFGIAAIIYFIGPSIRDLMKKRAGWVTATILVGTILGFIALYFL